MSSQIWPAEPFTQRTPRVVSCSKLHRGAERKKTGCFIAEGINSVEAALAAGVVRELFVSESFTHSADERAVNILHSCDRSNLPVHPVTDPGMDKLSGTTTPQGVIARCDSIVLTHVPHDLPARPLIVVENLSDPGNAGTIIRLADAFAASALVCVGSSVDPENSKVVRASAGSLFHLPVISLASVDEFVAAMQQQQREIIATDLSGTTMLHEIDSSHYNNAAWVFGSEAHGITEQMRQISSVRVKIDIPGHAESLNIASAAAICIHHGCTK